MQYIGTYDGAVYQNLHWSSKEKKLTYFDNNVILLNYRHKKYCSVYQSKMLESQ